MFLEWVLHRRRNAVAVLHRCGNGNLPDNAVALDRSVHGPGDADDLLYRRTHGELLEPRGVQAVPLWERLC
jgi:hypothetical protein